jgi:hypothetical protein
MFPDTASFQRINMYHTDHDNAEAAKKAMEYLQASMYKDRLPNAGLYYAQLVEREKALKGLNTPKLGDSLLKLDGTPWMADLQKMAPKLNWDDLNQVAAFPLGSWIKTDPWDDKEHVLNAKRYAPMNARDKMPFEVTPVFYKLQRYDVAHVDAPSSGAAPAPGSGTPTPPPAGTDPAAQPQQPADGQAPQNPPATGTAPPQASGDSTAQAPNTAAPTPQ